jgi:hypothetical protein
MTNMLSLALLLIAIPQIQFDKPKSEGHLPNPSILRAARDELRAVAKQMLETREIPLEREDCNAQTGECTLISKPIIFIKGITTRSQLEHYCEVPASSVRNWTKGRYSLRITITPVTPTTAQVGVYARFEGMPDGVLDNDWMPLTSKGELEDKLLRCLDLRSKGVECKDEIK